MESLSRPFHRRKLSNANGKNAYDGVFSGHRPKFDRAPTVHLDEYREIFGSGQTVSSIPILDLSNLEHQQDEDDASDGLKPDYGLIFGGFRDSDIAVSYQELIARDKARAPASTNQSSQDFDDQSHQSFDALKQFNMSYNKISQRSKDGLDGTTHVTQLHAVPGYTCFIDESASQPNKETENQQSSLKNNVHEKQTSQTEVESRSKHHQDNSFSGDKSSTTIQNDIKLHPSEVLLPPVASSTNEASSQPQMEIEKQKSSVADNIYPSMNSRKVDSHEKQTSPNALECKEHRQDNSLFGDKNSKTWQTDIKAHLTKVSSSPEASSANDETSSQLKKETEKQKSSVTNDIYPNVNIGKLDVHEKQTSRSAVESKIKERTDESISDDRNSNTFQADLKSNPSKISSPPPAASASNNETSLQPKKKTEKHKSSVTNDIYSSASNSKLDFHEKQTSRSAVEIKSKDHPDEFLSDGRFSKTSQADLRSHPSKISLPPPVASATNVDSYKGYQRRSTATNNGTHKSDTSGEFPPTCFSEELDVNSAAAISAAALQKAIEKAQESIRIAKESVGRKKEGLRGYSNKSFKDSLKVKARVSNVRTFEEHKEKDDKMKASRIFSNGSSHRKHGGTVVYSESVDGENLYGAKKVINDIRGKIPESTKNSEMPVSPSHELREDKNVYNSKEAVGEKMSSESIKNNTYEASQRDSQRFKGYLVIESCEKKLEDLEDKIDNDKARESDENIDEVRPSDSRKLVGDLNNLTLYHEVDDERNDQNGYEKSFNEILGLLENKKQEVLEKERDETVVSAESDDEASEKVLEDERELKDTESHKEEDTGEKFYDVCEVEMIENTQTSANSLGTNEVSPKENENDKEEKPFEKFDQFEEPHIYENSSSDYDDAEESESVHGCIGANHIVFDTQKACKVDQNDNNSESGPEIDDVRCSSAQEFQVEDTEAIKKDIFEDISADQTSFEDNEDECDDVSNCVLADVDFVQDDVWSGSSSDTIHGMEIEVKEYKEREETAVSVKEEESNSQHSHEETPEIRINMETGTSQERKDESGESGPSKVVEKERNKRTKEVTAEERERERVKLAVERAIREARERAFVEARDRAERAAVEKANAEVRQRVMSDAQEKVVKTSAQSKLKAERAAVERATAEARQRALEKAMSQKKTSEPRVQVNEVKQTSSSVSHTNVESALRSKAKLEKHNRIMERAAKALAEKEKRDMLVLKEQAERSRLADNLDADIKRWSTGKEGNLRALLSTLQYILGAESGWQPVSLTEIITTTAVKKAYRKATLCVHPDKLQQRGASIQQKYICEKVFDLLKAAWNRFNSEER